MFSLSILLISLFVVVAFSQFCYQNCLCDNGLLSCHSASTPISALGCREACNKLLLLNSTISALDGDKQNFIGFSGYNSFDLSNIGLQTIDPGAFFNSSDDIQELILSQNKISKLENGVVRGVKNLNILDISFNSISDVESEALTGTKLVYLNVSSNSLRFLGCNIRDMMTLKTLDISYNLITQVDLETLPTGLKTFIASSNGMSALDGCKSSNSACQSLDTLDLSYNSFDGLNSSALKYLNNLQNLFLQRNNISVIPYDLFSDLFQVRLINLSDNNIKVLPYHIFDNQFYLRELDISNNLITAFEILHYRTLFKMEILFIQNNSIETIDAQSFADMNLKHISLDDNKFLCIELYKILDDFANLNVEVHSNNVTRNETNLYGIFCYNDFFNDVAVYFKSNLQTIVFVLLSVVIVLLTIPWVVKFFRNRKRRNSQSSEIELFSQ